MKLNITAFLQPFKPITNNNETTYLPELFSAEKRTSRKTHEPPRVSIFRKSMVENPWGFTLGFSTQEVGGPGAAAKAAPSPSSSCVPALPRHPTGRRPGAARWSRTWSPKPGLRLSNSHGKSDGKPTIFHGKTIQRMAH